MKKNLPILFIFLIALIFWFLRPKITNQESPVISTPTTIKQSNNLVEPIAEFKQRITKKPFGIYITPKTSPIQPERFIGYHTGVDVEYGDITTDVPVYAITNGEIVYSGYVNGYGGVTIIKVQINNQNYLILYGHLNPNNLLKNGSLITPGQTIGILGRGYSSQTYGERKHLHFAIIKGVLIDFRGYVQNKSDLQIWLNPLDLFST